MKTLKELNKSIEDCTKSINKYSSKQEVESVKRRISFLRMCLRYVETNPREEYVLSQISEIEARIENIGSHFEEWKIGRNLSKYNDPYRAYLSEMNLSHFKAQLKTLKYLLS